MNFDKLTLSNLFESLVEQPAGEERSGGDVCDAVCRDPNLENGAYNYDQLVKSYRQLATGIAALLHNSTKDGSAKQTASSETDAPSSSIVGANVAVVLPNGLEFLVTFLAVAELRCVNVVLNPALKEEELEFAMENMQCKLVLILAESEKSGAAEATCAAARKLHIPVHKLCWNSDRKLVDIVGSPSISIGPTGLEKSQCCGEDIVLRLHTSGTTAKPKTVALKQSNLIFTIANIGRTYDFSAKDCGLLVMPLFHVHGLFAGLLAPLAWGAKVVFASGRGFHKQTFWQDCKAYNVNWATAVPSMWQILLIADEATKDKDAGASTNDGGLGLGGWKGKFRFIRGCSSAMAPETARICEEKLGTTVLEAYAMTEATHQMCSNPLRPVTVQSQDNNSVRSGKEATRTFGAVGLPTGIEVIIAIESESAASRATSPSGEAVGEGEGKGAVETSRSGKVVPRGTEGEICVRGHNVVGAYENLDPIINAGNFFTTIETTGDELSICSSVISLKESRGERGANSGSESESKGGKALDSAALLAHYRTHGPFVYRNELTTEKEDSLLAKRPFLRTGDIGVMDPETFMVRIVGRSKELINRGGEKLSPLKIDAALLTAGPVENAASFSYPHQVLGECVAACIVLTPETRTQSTEALKQIAAEVRSEIGSKKLAKFEVPEKMFFVQDLPKGPTGKVRRRDLYAAVKDTPSY